MQNGPERNPGSQKGFSESVVSLGCVLRVAARRHTGSSTQVSLNLSGVKTSLRRYYSFDHSEVQGTENIEGVRPSPPRIIAGLEI